MTFALEEEFARWRRRGGFEPDGRLDEVRAYRRRQGDIEVSAVLTSIGSQNAARTAARVLEASVFDLVISSGFAGGLRQGLRPGRVLVGRGVRWPGESGEIEPPPKWLARARELGAEEVTFITSSTAVATREEKQRLAAEADAVEMESFAILDQAQARGVPAIVIRAISDSAEMELPIDFDRVLDAKGHVQAAPLAAQLLRKPVAVAGLARLARESRRASASLAEFLDRYVATEAATGTGEG